MLGICNGFQILVESGLLPGALIRNRGLKFICRDVQLARRDHQLAVHQRATRQGQMLRMPIAHGEGCYIADERTLDELEAEDRVAFRYVDNPNGSLRDIAGSSQPGAQRDGHDAASRARHRAADGVHRRAGRLRIARSRTRPNQIIR